MPVTGSERSWAWLRHHDSNRLPTSRPPSRVLQRNSDHAFLSVLCRVAVASETLLSDSLGDNLQATGPTKDWPGLTSEAPDAGRRTWSDFMVFLHARLPPKRKTERIEVSSQRLRGFTCLCEWQLTPRLNTSPAWSSPPRAAHLSKPSAEARRCTMLV